VIQTSSVKRTYKTLHFRAFRGAIFITKVNIVSNENNLQLKLAASFPPPKPLSSFRKKV
jgi:hypothetical protein